MGYFSVIISDAKRSRNFDRNSLGNSFTPTGEVPGSIAFHEDSVPSQMEHSASSQRDLTFNNHSVQINNDKLPNSKGNRVEHTKFKISDNQLKNKLQDKIDNHHSDGLFVKKDKHSIKPKKNIHVNDKVGGLKVKLQHTTIRLENKTTKSDTKEQQFNYRQENESRINAELIKASKNDGVQYANSQPTQKNKQNFKQEYCNIENNNYNPFENRRGQQQINNHEQKIESAKENISPETLSFDAVLKSSETHEQPKVDLHFGVDKQNEDIPCHVERDELPNTPKSSKPKDHQSELPKVMIGQIDVYVTAPEKTVTSHNRESTTSSFLSRYYIKGL